MIRVQRNQVAIKQKLGENLKIVIVIVLNERTQGDQHVDDLRQYLRVFARMLQNRSATVISDLIVI